MLIFRTESSFDEVCGRIVLDGWVNKVKEGYSAEFSLKCRRGGIRKKITDEQNNIIPLHSA